MDWLQLKSGSDVRGTATGEGTVLTDDIAMRLGMAFALWLSEKKGVPVKQITVALGRDSRITGEALLHAAAEGIRKCGASVLDFGMCTTPAMYMSILSPQFHPDGSVMITASHHPWNKNGLKFFSEKGGLEGKDIEHLLREAQSLKPEEFTGQEGSLTREDYLAVYKSQLAERIRTGLKDDSDKPLEGLHAVVDAGNGAGGFYADLLQSLGACTEGSQFLNPDGYFPNHIPNPENADAMKSLRNAVIRSGADLGVIFDADCDRAAIVDADGKEINRNRLIALISAILLDQESGQTIVTDSVTSSGLKTFIENHGGTHYRYKRGYRNVIDEAVLLNQQGISCPLAIETSGHAALRENHFLDDGMYLVTVLIVRAMEMKKAGKTLGSIIADLKEPAESTELRLNILDPDFRAKGNEAIGKVLQYAEHHSDWHVAPDNREGIRISFDIGGQPDAGWFLLRLSVHDPVLPLNAESDVPGGVRDILTRLDSVIGGMEGIEMKSLKEIVGESSAAR